MQETQVRFLDGEDSLGKEMATHTIILAWKILWDRGARWGIVHGVRKKPDTMEWLSMHAHMCIT